MYANLKALKESTIGKAREIHDKAIKEGRDLTALEQTAFDSLLNAYQAATGRKIPGDKEGFASYCNSPDPDGLSNDQIGASMLQGGNGGVTLYDNNGRAVRGLGKGESFAAAIAQHGKFARTTYGQELVNDGLTLGGYLRAMVTGPRNKVEMAALNSGSGGSGGYTVPEFLSAQLVDRFRARMVCSRLGALTIPLTGNNGTFTFTKITADPTPSWRHELTSIDESEPTFGAITLTPRSLAVEVRCSRELLQDSQNIEAAIEKTMAAAFALEVDRVGLFGMGSAAEPMGIANGTGVNSVTSVGTPANYTKILDAYKLLLDDNAPEPTGLVYSPQEWRSYAGLADTTNQPMMRPQAIANLPFEATSACTAGTMIMGAFPELAFGMRSEFTVDVLKELHAQTHEFGFVGHLRMDTAVFHPEAFCKLTGATT